MSFRAGQYKFLVLINEKYDTSYWGNFKET
jgi:hypothetical protein